MFRGWHSSGIMKGKRSLLLPLTLLLVVIMFLLIHDLLGGTLLSSSPYNSYTRQALAWREGRFYLDQDYPWLELAIYGGRYYVSFPPVPSLVMLPLTFLFGVSTPDNVVALVFCLLMITAFYFVCRNAGASERASVFFSVFIVLGSNLFWMCSDGSVWFLAQSLNMVFCSFAILFAFKNKRTAAFLMTAFAVGCRPFSVLMFLPLLVLFVCRDVQEKKMSLFKAVLSQWKYLIAAAAVGAAYMVFNYLRFHDPLEFGHTFLPEFNRGEPQFSVTFILRNLAKIFRPVTLSDTLSLEYPVHDGFLFFLANPFFVYAFSNLRFARKWTVWQWCSLGCLLMNLLLLLMHRTFGGWQFGARYTVDLIPYAVLFSVPYLSRPVRNWHLLLGAFAILFNLYGTLVMHLLYS